MLQRVFQSALAYAGMVMAAGFMLGMVRVPFLVPRLGERWAELLEMPVMAVVIFFSARHVMRVFPDLHTPGRSLGMGFLALAFSIGAELGLAWALQDQSISAYVASRDRISGSVYVALLLVFALLPRLRLVQVAPLTAIKAAHTVAWALFAGCIVALPWFAWRRQFEVALVLIGIVTVEILILVFNRFRCPLTAIAARYTTDTRDNFDIYLPLWLARYNKQIFGTLFAVGVAYTLLQWRQG